MADEYGKKDYQVGYGKPPKHSQFKPGQSGNPTGRPRDSRNVKSVLIEVAQEEMVITENGESKVVSKQEALIRSLYAQALSGDKQAIRILLKIWDRYSGNFLR